MEFIRTLREKQRTQRQADIEKNAVALIRVADFADSLYIAYDGTPLVPIEESWTSKEILHELSILRNNYVNSKILENGLKEATAV